MKDPFPPERLAVAWGVAVLLVGVIAALLIFAP